MSHDYTNAVISGMHNMFVYPFMYNLNYCVNTWNIKTVVGKENFSVVYDFNVYPSNSTYTKKSSTYSTLPSADQMDLYPLAVRYHDPQTGVFVVERPPFQTEIDFSFKKGSSRKVHALLKGRKMWIPWTVYVFTAPTNNSNNFNNNRAYVYFNDKQLTSVDDLLASCYLPNTYNDGAICFGDSSNNYYNRVAKQEIPYNISTFFNYLINDFYSSWNRDLGPYMNKNAFDYLKNNGILDAAKNSTKSLKEDYLNYNSWLIGSNAWPYLLLALSHMDYDQMIGFVDYMRTRSTSSIANISQLENGIVQRTVSLRQLISYFTSNDTSSVLSHRNFNVITEPNRSSALFARTHNQHLRSIMGVNSIFNLRPEVKFKNVDTTINYSSLLSNSVVLATIYRSIFKCFNDAFSKYKKEFLSDLVYPSLNAVEKHVIATATMETLFGGTDVITIGALKQISHHPYLERFINGISQSFYTTYYNILIEIDYSYISSFTHHQPVIEEIDPPASNIVDQFQGNYTDAF